MAYVNVRDWSVDQVTDWLKGLDSIIQQYITSFLNNGVAGHQLLNLRADDLEHLGVKSLGHQEIILEAVEHLRHIHYELDKENLQMLALRVSCASNSLYRELNYCEDSAVVQKQTLSDVHNIISIIKPLICWLDRAPFVGDKDYIDCKTELLELSFQMATNAHRGIFSEKPVSSIRKICEKITKIADHIVQEVSDPMILQPASLDLATLKKKEQELGFLFSPHNHAIHQIGEIKYGSPAHSSTKIEEGDEVVQVNYQTVVGWQRKNVMLLLQDSPPEIVLTLKKRPRHTKVYGQIYMKPLRLPSNKRQPYSRWNDSIQSPRLLPIHNLPPINIPKLPIVVEPQDVETELSSSDDSETPDSPLDGSGRMYPLKPRPILQRRNTITGSTPTSKRPYPSVEQYWQIFKHQATSIHASAHHIDNLDQDANFLRDKSVSCNLQLELTPRRTTVIGSLGGQRSGTKTSSFKKDFIDKPTTTTCKKRVNFQENKQEIDLQKQQNVEQHLFLEPATTNLNDEKSVSVNSLASLTNENIAFIDEGRELTDRSSMVTNEDDKVKDSALADVKIHDIIRKFDDKVVNKPKIYPRSQAKKPPDVPLKPDKKPVVPPRSLTTKLRGRLDKSHSTPAYDLTGEENSPVVEKFVVEKSPVVVLPDVVVSPDVEPTVPLAPELGIPIIPITETINPIIEPIEIEKSEFTTDVKEELPPKPPPRTINLEQNKPAYPSDSPKPNIGDKIKNNSEVQVQKTIFEFPDAKQTLTSIENSLIKATNEPTTPSTLKIYSNNENKAIRQFEPKVSSTPKLKNEHEDSASFVKSSSFEVQKSTSDSKISPTNSIVRAMMYSNKSKSGKKKNSISARRRKVTVADLTPNENQGYLYQRLRSKHNQNVHWEKRWFVLLGSCLYGFKSKDDPRAACLIFLSGFTVAVASEVKSRSNAFKVYHTGTVFYFSAEDSEILQEWIMTITAATLNNESLKNADNSLYSETDESDSEKPKKIEPEKTQTESLRKFGSLKKFTGKKSDGSVHSGSTSLDRKWFFNKSSTHSKNSIPVPTAQFRSYRKVRSSDANANNNSSVTTGNFTSHVQLFSRNDSTLLNKSGQNVSVPNLTVDTLGKSDLKSNSKLSSQIKPINYVHASNPSLCNVNQFNVTSTSTSFGKKSSSMKQNCNENLAGFVTLEELMNKQTEERRSNPYNMDEDLTFNLTLIKPDVVYGEVPIRPKDKVDFGDGEFKKGHSRNASDSHKSDNKEFTSSCFGKRLGSMKKSSHKEDKNDEVVLRSDQKMNRSLPRTHKMNDKYEKSNNVYASDRNLSFKERSYEMIYCPETTSDIQFAQNRTLDDRMYKDTPKKSLKIKRQHSFTLNDKLGESTGGKYTNKVGDSSRMKLKSAGQYTPMTLPLGSQKNKKLLAVDEKGKGNKGEGKKKKNFLYSPILHRTIFGKSSNESDVFQINPTSTTQALSPSQTTLKTVPCDLPSIDMNMSPHADYPGLEYPPVFEPETYSLADPQSSLTLLRKQHKNNN